jgi:hypothetical protein
MDLERLVVTVLGLGLIVAVNLYFFARPRGASRQVQAGPASADETRAGPAGRA